jgi:xanthine dehydrogenase molybdopterin-binding subunit B
LQPRRIAFLKSRLPVPSFVLAISVYEEMRDAVASVGSGGHMR